MYKNTIKLLQYIKSYLTFVSFSATETKKRYFYMGFSKIVVRCVPSLEKEGMASPCPCSTTPWDLAHLVFLILGAGQSIVIQCYPWKPMEIAGAQKLYFFQAVECPVYGPNGLNVM